MRVHFAHARAILLDEPGSVVLAEVLTVATQRLRGVLCKTVFILSTLN